MVLALALLSISAWAQGSYGIAGGNGVDILGEGIFETTGAAVKFPAFQDTNIDDLIVGNDKATAFGNPWQKVPLATAVNNLEVKKNQDSGACAACSDVFGNCSDACIKVNIEQIKIGSRDAMAFGFAAATNNVKIVTNQQ